MDQKLLEKLKTRLEKKEKDLKKDLKRFAKKDKNLKGDYDTKFPQIGEDSDENASEVNIYESTLPVEFALEKKLQAVKGALERIKKGQYGKCQSCGKKISAKRLEALPEAETCLKCAK